MLEDDNSFEEYKRHLEKTMGISGIQAPKSPMNAFMRFFLERSSEERSKGDKRWNELTKALSLEWKTLSDNRKEYYQKIYNIRIRERTALLEEFNKLSGKRKPLPPYARYVKKRYAQYSKEYKNSSSSEINKLVKNDWKNLSVKEKKKYEDEYEKEKNDLSLDIDNSDRTAEYEDRLNRYHDQLIEDKEKVLRKYGITKESKIIAKRQHREEVIKKRRASKKLESEQKRRERNEQKQRERDIKNKKIREEKEAERTRKEEAKQKERQAKLKVKADDASKKKKQVQTPRKHSKSKPKVKATVAEPAVAKETLKKSKKSKPIKKKEVKKASATKPKAKPKKPKAKPKKAKAKSAKSSKRGKRR